MTLKVLGTYQYKRRFLFFTIGKAAPQPIAWTVPLNQFASKTFTKSFGPVDIIINLEGSTSVSVTIDAFGVPVFSELVHTDKAWHIREKSVNLDVQVTLEA